MLIQDSGHAERNRTQRSSTPWTVWTQWQLVATCERLSEACLLLVLQALLKGFPFVILSFHADNGSEYINNTVAKFLEKLRIESPLPRHSRRPPDAALEPSDSRCACSPPDVSVVPRPH